MHLSRNELVRIIKVMDAFDLNAVDIDSTSNGIGSSVEVSFTVKEKDYMVTKLIDLTDVSEW